MMGPCDPQTLRALHPKLGVSHHLVTDGSSSPAPRTLLVQKRVSHCLRRRRGKHIHLLYQAARALPYICRGTDEASAQANDHKNALVSSDHLPPTSPAMTTSRAWPLPWHNSGCVLSLRLLASRNATPSSASSLLR